jgi:hypothetical protein
MDDRRRVPRYFANLTAVLTHQVSGVSEPVQVEVLSVQGCCVRGKPVPEVGRKCRLTMHWQTGEIRTEAEVAWKDAQGLSGLRFLGMDQESSEALRELCATLRLQPMTPWTALENP